MMMPPPEVVYVQQPRPDTNSSEIQCNILEMRTLQVKEQEIQNLQNQINERNLKIDEIEKQMNQLKEIKTMSESDQIKKMRFDN